MKQRYEPHCGYRKGRYVCVYNTEFPSGRLALSPMQPVFAEWHIACLETCRGWSGLCARYGCQTAV